MGTSEGWTTIVGIGSLLSERSSHHNHTSAPTLEILFSPPSPRLSHYPYKHTHRSALGTFPGLTNFRLARLSGAAWRRVFAHPAAFFFEKGIAKWDSKEICSLSCEPSDFLAQERTRNGQASSRHDEREDAETDTELGLKESPAPSFQVAAFEIEDVDLPAFYQREEEYCIESVTVEELDGSRIKGLLCTRASDQHFVDLYGEAAFETRYRAHGMNTIWDWHLPPHCDHTVLPCRLYLRHCLLAAEKWGPAVYADFLDTTYLADRSTRLRSYVELHLEAIMGEIAPPGSGLEHRYNG